MQLVPYLLQKWQGIRIFSVQVQQQQGVDDCDLLLFTRGKNTTLNNLIFWDRNTLEQKDALKVDNFIKN